MDKQPDASLQDSIDEVLWQECVAAIPSTHPAEQALPCLVGVIDGGIKVYIVDGDKVKLIHDADYVEGGSGERFPFIPKNEIWLDDRIVITDLQYILIHEATERRLMANEGLDYYAAHERANGVELFHRRRWLEEHQPLLERSSTIGDKSYPVQVEMTRLIMDPPRNADGLFSQPKATGPEREKKEAHNRERFSNHFKYADPFSGNTRTFDEQGDYNCGRCNQFDDGSCLLLKRKSVDASAGSCGDWENKCAGDPELVLEEKSDDAAGYGVAANGKGFGCHRCPYASKAIEPDSQGRDLYCGKGDFRVFHNACCVLNGAPLKGEDNTGNKALLERSSIEDPHSLSGQASTILPEMKKMPAGQRIGKHAAARTLGHYGGKHGGLARDRKLSKKEKKAIARMGARARWKRKMLDQDAGNVEQK